MITKGKYLITTERWFVAPDGNQYTAVWGDCEVFTTKDSMGFNPTRSTNWFLKVRNGGAGFLIAGCQINYAIECPEKPKIKNHTYTDKETGAEMNANNIYIP